MDAKLPQVSVAQQLAERIAALRPDALPAAVRNKCEDLLIDVVGLCVTARSEDYIKSALAEVSVRACPMAVHGPSSSQPASALVM